MIQLRKEGILIPKINKHLARKSEIKRSLIFLSPDTGRGVCRLCSISTRTNSFANAYALNRFLAETHKRICWRLPIRKKLTFYRCGISTQRIFRLYQERERRWPWVAITFYTKVFLKLTMNIDGYAN